MPIKFLVKPINGSVLVFMEILACSCPKNHAAQSPNHSHMTVRHSGRPPVMGPAVETPDLLPCPAERGAGGGGQADVRCTHLWSQAAPSAPNPTLLSGVSASRAQKFRAGSATFPFDKCGD